MSWERKPIGYFKHALAVDCETSGLATRQINPTYDPITGKSYQAVSFAMIIVDMETLEEVEELYVEIKWNGEAEWSKEAENIHGLTKNYLDINGLDEKDALCLMAELILKYFGPDNVIPLMGHNVATFDRYFLDGLFRKYGIALKFGSRNIDTLTIGAVLFNLFNSDELFNRVGLQKRTKHNALEDIKYTIETLRTVKTLWNTFVTPAIS